MQMQFSREYTPRLLSFLTQKMVSMWLMQNPRRAMLVVGVFGGLFPLTTGIQAQTNSFPSGKSIPALQNTQLQHAPSIRSGPIDLSKYSSDVLNCAICRERLGLPALGPSTASANKTELMLPTVSNPTPRILTFPT